MLKQYLEHALETNNYALSLVLQEQLLAYLDLLQKWNRVFNLTAIRDPQEMVLLHILDSLSINAYLHGQRIIDVGTGAGLPGIPLALMNPERQFVLLDSNSKKTRFLTQAIHELKIQNIEVIHARCENYDPEEKFDTIVSRAFASIQVMLTTTQHLLREKGQFLAMKGVYPESEITAIPDGFNVMAVHTLNIKGLEAERCAVCITKQHKG